MFHSTFMDWWEIITGHFFQSRYYIESNGTICVVIILGLCVFNILESRLWLSLPVPLVTYTGPSLPEHIVEIGCKEKQVSLLHNCRFCLLHILSLTYDLEGKAFLEADCLPHPFIHAAFSLKPCICRVSIWIPSGVIWVQSCGKFSYSSFQSVSSFMPVFWIHIDKKLF